MTTSSPPQSPNQRAGQDRNAWRAHMRGTLVLGLPLVGAQLAQIAIHVTDTVMIGWLGAVPLAASVLGTQLFFVVFLFGSGFTYAILPLASAAVGEDDERGVRRSVRMGGWVTFIYCALMMPPMWFAEDLFLVLKQDPEVSALAASYVRVAQWALFPALMMMVLRAFLSALERTQIVLLATLIGVGLNVLLNWMFIFGNLGAPELGIVGAAIASVGSSTVIFLVLLGYALSVRDLERYAIFVRLWRPDWDAFAEVLRLGFPIGGMLLAEVGLFAMSSIMMGWIGTIELAAHGIALQVISVLFMIPYGLSQAGTVRVGQAFGRRDALGIERASKTALVLAIGVGIASAIMFWVIPETLIRIFLDAGDPDTAQIVIVGSTLLAVAAAFQLVDMLQAVSAGLLRGLKDTTMPMVIAVLSYWALGVPAAWFLAFPLGLEGVGVWAGMALGLLLAAILLTGRLLMRERLGLLPWLRA